MLKSKDSHYGGSPLRGIETRSYAPTPKSGNFVTTVAHPFGGLKQSGVLLSLLVAEFVTTVAHPFGGLKQLIHCRGRLGYEWSLRWLTPSGD